MKRRRLVVGLGVLAAGVSTTVGSGAFSSIEAERSISVSVENDRDAYLALTPTASDFSTMTDQSILKFEFGGDVSPPGGTNRDTGSGVAPNSVYEFNNLFKIENQGPDDIVVFGREDNKGNIGIGLITDKRGQPLTADSPSDNILAPGGHQVFGLRISVGDIEPPVNTNTKINITAATSESERFSLSDN